MTNFSQKIAKLTAIATFVATVALPMQTLAAEFQTVATQPVVIGDWHVSTLSRDSADIRIEAYKVDKNLVAWTELSTGSSFVSRNLYVFNGVETRLVASFNKNDWKDDGNGFYDAVTGNFDVADGKVVWTMFDGNDREIYAFDGERVTQVSDNKYDDRHPITSKGRVAWTSAPSADAYNLMVRDQFGIRRVDAWPVTNYAFSGTNLFWLNTRPNEPWMHVFVNTGLVNSTIGQGDDRSWMQEYFIVDGKGNAAWEYSTKNWSYDKRITYVSVGGANAVQLIQRDVPPMVTRIEDMDQGKVMISITDLLLTDLQHKTTTLELIGGWIQDAVFRKEVPSKIRYMDGGYVRHREPGADNVILFHSTETGAEDFITNEAVLMDRFEADGSAAAGARKAGGIVVYADGNSEVIPSSVQAESLKVKNGNVAWVEGIAGSQVLKFASTGVLVSAANGGAVLTGSLVKAGNSPAVYFAARDGQRYVIPGEATFFTWFKDFSSVVTVSPAKLASMPLAGKVMYRPDAYLVKTAGSNRVYAVGKDGQLHWVMDEATAVALHGANWNKKVLVIGEGEFAGYAVGNGINATVAQLYR